MHRISERVKDKRVLRLIRFYLKSGIMLKGVRIKSEQREKCGR